MYLLFFLFWVIFNGQLTFEIGIIGIFVAALLYAFICKFMGWSPKKDIFMMQYTGFMLCYLFVLIREIIKANMDTVKMIFTSRYEREPVLVAFRSNSGKFHYVDAGNHYGFFRRGYLYGACSG